MCLARLFLLGGLLSAQRRGGGNRTADIAAAEASRNAMDPVHTLGRDTVKPGKACRNRLDMAHHWHTTGTRTRLSLHDWQWRWPQQPGVHMFHARTHVSDAGRSTALDLQAHKGAPHTTAPRPTSTTSPTSPTSPSSPLPTPSPTPTPTPTSTPTRVPYSATHYRPHKRKQRFVHTHCV